MSRWAVLCLYCEWSCETDDLDDGAAQADKHAEVCDGLPLAEVAP